MTDPRPQSKNDRPAAIARQRRQLIAGLALGGTSVGSTFIGGMFLGGAAIGGAARAQATAPGQVPPLSAGAVGPALPPGWQHQTLPKVARANQFALVDEGDQRVLQIRSQASASSWAAPLDVDAARLPMLQWRWKVSRALTASDLRRREADDYAARLYVLFALPTERLSLADRLRIQTARLLAGIDVPAAALCYVWGRAQPVGSSGWNPYTDRVRMVVVDSGDEHAGQWRAHRRDIRSDWAEAFGGALPRISGLAVSADTDNTGEQVETWFADPRFGAASQGNVALPLSLIPAGGGRLRPALGHS